MSISTETKFFTKVIAASALTGAILCALVGFKVGGWYSAGQAKDFASRTADTAVVEALTPVCAASFVALATPEQMADLKAKESYNRNEVVEKVVKMSVPVSIRYQLASGCAALVLKPQEKTAAVK